MNRIWAFNSTEYPPKRKFPREARVFNGGLTCSKRSVVSMIIIDTIVKTSTVAGLGIFANEDVKAGDVIWILHPSVGNSIVKLTGS